MTPSRFWTVLAFGQPACTLLLWSLISRRARLTTWCQVGLAHVSNRTFGLIVLSFVVLAISIGLTFVTDALRNERLTAESRALWVVALLLASPIVAPAYWLQHLR